MTCVMTDSTFATGAGGYMATEPYVKGRGKSVKRGARGGSENRKTAQKNV